MPGHNNEQCPGQNLDIAQRKANLSTEINQQADTSTLVKTSTDREVTFGIWILDSNLHNTGCGPKRIRAATGCMVSSTCMVSSIRHASRPPKGTVGIDSRFKLMRGPGMNQRDYVAVQEGPARRGREALHPPGAGRVQCVEQRQVEHVQLAYPVLIAVPLSLRCDHHAEEAPTRLDDSWPVPNRLHQTERNAPAASAPASSVRRACAAPYRLL